MKPIQPFTVAGPSARWAEGRGLGAVLRPGKSYISGRSESEVAEGHIESCFLVFLQACFLKSQAIWNFANGNDMNKLESFACRI